MYLPFKAGLHSGLHFRFFSVGKKKYFLFLVHLESGAPILQEEGDLRKFRS